MKALLKRLCKPLFREELEHILVLESNYDAAVDRERRMEDRDNGRLDVIVDLREKLDRAESSLAEEVKKRSDELAELTASRNSRNALELTNASLQHENEFLRTQFEQAIKNERYALRFMANIQTQSTYGVKPFEDTAGLPENVSLPESSNEPVRVQGIDMVNHARQQFVAELRRREANGESLPIHPDILEAAALTL